MRGFGFDILWAYAASLARVLSWVVVFGTLYRRVGAEAAAGLALVRWTLGLLNYASAGLGPAILHHAAKAEKEGSGFGVQGSGEGVVLDYQSAIRNPQSAIPSARSIYRNGIALSWLGTLVGFLALWSWTLTEGRARGVATLVGLFGTGMLIDIAADAWGAVLQSRGRMRRDYQCQVSLEFIWAACAITLTLTRDRLGISWQTAVGGSYLAAAVLTAALRAYFSHRALVAATATDASLAPRAIKPPLDRRVMLHLLSFGGLVMLAQVADFLYAPTDFLLIQWLIDLKTVAVYAPAVQLDAGILLLVGGLSTALLPMSASAFAKGDTATVRRYYIQGTLVSFALLLVVATLAFVASPGIFKGWLGDKMRPTQHILPLVFIPTVIGGSAGVGRSVLFAIGKVRAFTIAALISGVANVVLSYSFVRFGGLGLTGIILGTIIVVTVRCGIWMPWYVLRSLRKLSSVPPPALATTHVME